MKIHKTTITVTVLHHAGELPNDLAAVLEEMDTGCAVGEETARVTVELADADVFDELLALGNDGEFFNDDD